MQLVANILLAVGATGAGLYCLVLARRLRQFTQLETGMGGAIAVLSMQVDELKQALATAQAAAAASEARLAALTARAEAAAALLAAEGARHQEDSRPLRLVRGKRHAGQEAAAHEVGHG